MERSRSWISVVDDTLPLATASPVQTQASPSEAVRRLAGVGRRDRAEDRSPSGRRRRALSATELGVLVSVAWLCGDVADGGVDAAVGDADADVGHAADLGADDEAEVRRPCRSGPAVRLVAEALPVARAPPVLTLAVPSELLLASPELEAVTAPTAVMSIVAAVVVRADAGRPGRASARWFGPEQSSWPEALPTATLRPLLATPTPTLATPATWVPITRPSAVDGAVGVLAEVGGGHVALALGAAGDDVGRCRRRCCWPRRCSTP